MQVTVSPLKFMAQSSPLAALPGGVPAGIGGAGVLRYTGAEGTDSVRVSGALTADELMPGAALGVAATADGSLDELIPFGAKVRMELSTDYAAPSPALAGYLQLLETNKEAIAGLASNVDESLFDDPEAALAYLRSMSKDEFIFGAQAGEKSILWRGKLEQLPTGLQDVVKGSDALFGTLA